jgi:hypothetical protein
VLGSPGDVWNWIGFGNFDPTLTPAGPISLVDTGNNPTTAVLNFQAVGGVLSLATGTQPVPNLTNNYLYNNQGGPIDVDLSGLIASAPYALVLYVASDDGVGGVRSLTGSANGTNFTATGTPQSSFVNGQNVVLLNVTSDSYGDLDVTLNNGGNSNEIDMNGLQLQTGSIPTPEPASGAILAIGLLGAGLVLRRQKGH